MSNRFKFGEKQLQALTFYCNNLKTENFETNFLLVFYNFGDFEHEMKNYFHDW